MANLLDSAVKYTTEGGAFRVEAHRTGGEVTMSAGDSGPDIMEEDLGSVLRRFYRLGASRNTPGSGLGLSLVAAVARLHGAQLELKKGTPGLDISFHFK